MDKKIESCPFVGYCFRPLDLKEQEALLAATVARRGIDPTTRIGYPEVPVDDLRVIEIEALRVGFQELPGGFTVCLLALESYGEDLEPQVLIWCGMSRSNTKRNEAQAFSRAISNGRPGKISGAVLLRDPCPQWLDERPRPTVIFPSFGEEEQ